MASKKGDKSIKRAVRGFIPRSNYERYSYVTSLVDYDEELYDKSRNLLEDAIGRFSSVYQDKSFSTLEDLIEAEKSAEKSYINNVLPPEMKNRFEVTDSSSWKDFIEAINYTNNFYTTYETNVKRILQKKGKATVDSSKFFATYLSKALIEYFNKENITELTEDSITTIIKNALLLTYKENSKDFKDDPDFKAYQELQQLFSSMDTNNKIFTQIATLYDIYGLREKINEIVARARRNDKNLRQASFTRAINNQARKSGTLLEYIDEAVQNTILNGVKANKNIEAVTIGMGRHEWKGDVVELYDGTVRYANEFDNELNDKTEDGSKRLNTFKRLEEIFTKMKNAKGSIVFISDKNYMLDTQYFKGGAFEDNVGGFSAGSSSNLSIFEAILRKANVENIEELIFALTNVGDETVGETTDYDGIMKYLASKIGYFVFDDTVIAESVQTSSINRVHIFNLGNIYVPLSVFLEATLKALREMKDNGYQDYVTVAFSPHGVYENKIRTLKKEDWDNYRDKRMKESKISFHFFRGFTSFVRNYLG